MDVQQNVSTISWVSDGERSRAPFGRRLNGLALT
jgi:hypothetical protein